MKRGGPLKRSGFAGFKKREPIRLVNRARKKKRNAEAFGVQAQFCRESDCCVPDCLVTPCDPAHVVSRGAGGKDRHCVPLCRHHHRQQHDKGMRTFERLHGINLTAIAARISERFYPSAKGEPEGEPLGPKGEEA